ncbi:uncharacterized protein [Diabrotica undecimpunctata]|uniref:uncharacterized protein n=1 Tax=Diabrotica undecimpunctata TaxID=50387 RepID=UPI003B640BE8
MNGECFEDWFENKLIANLPKGEKNMSSWKKQQIQEWLREKDIFYEEEYLKSELLDGANSYADIYDKYNIETLVEKYGVEVLRLPPYHCELNPIEMVWSQVKHYVADRNTDFKKDRVQQLIHEAFANVSAEQWQNYIQHVIRIEKEMWIADNLQEDILPVIISQHRQFQ